jgi:hypothetical protein
MKLKEAVAVILTMTVILGVDAFKEASFGLRTDFRGLRSQRMKVVRMSVLNAGGNFVDGLRVKKVLVPQLTKALAKDMYFYEINGRRM